MESKHGAQKKEFDFSLLSSDPEFIKRMANHPLVLWKKTSKKAKRE
jgi:hypothetical protein